MIPSSYRSNKTHVWEISEPERPSAGVKIKVKFVPIANNCHVGEVAVRESTRAQRRKTLMGHAHSFYAVGAGVYM